MLDLKTVQNLVIWLGSFIVVVSIFLYIADRPNRKGRSHWSPFDVWVLLILELISFGAVAIVVSIFKEPKELADYLAFSSPCAAAIIVGLGLVKRATRKLPDNLTKECCSKDANSDTDWDFKSYVWSSGILFGALIAYLAAKFDPKVIGWSICLFVFCSLIAYVVSFNKSEGTKWNYKSKTPQVLILSVLLILMIFAFMWMAKGS